jgi:uroporphyrin-III C-methyltransferase
VRVIDVGKRGGCASTPQPFIDRLMARLAKRGAVVGRVKGGDPYVFGRGAEEVAALEAAGVPVEVVSGVTAGIAVPAALGIPVTSRHLARGVTLVTGHARGRNRAGLGARAGRTTLVIYWACAARRHRHRPTRSRMRHPRPRRRSRTGRCRSRRASSRRSGAWARRRRARDRSPAVVVVGDVVALVRRQGRGLVEAAHASMR